jgi:hypothetical protein
VKLVWEAQRDRAAGEHRERECGLGRVKAVGAADDESDLVVERFGAALVDAQADGGEDAGAVLADRLAEPGERLQAAAREARQEPVDEDLDVGDGEAGREDRAGGFFERVGAPDLAAGGFEAPQRGGLLVGELRRGFEQRPAGVFEAFGGVLVAERAQLVPVGAADLVERLVGVLDDVEGSMQMTACGACQRAAAAYPGPMSSEIASSRAARSATVGLGSRAAQRSRADSEASAMSDASSLGGGAARGESGSSSAKNASAAFSPTPLQPHTILADR